MESKVEKNKRKKCYDKVFNCSKCGKSMHGKNSLFRHISTIHMNIEKQYCCTFCTKRFHRKDDKVNHEKTCQARMELPNTIPTVHTSLIKRSTTCEDDSSISDFTVPSLGLKFEDDSSVSDITASPPGLKCEDDSRVSDIIAPPLGMAWQGAVYLLQSQGRTLTLLDVSTEGKAKQIVSIPLPFPPSQVLPHPTHCGVLLLSCSSRLLLLHLEPGGRLSSSKELALPFLTSSSSLSWPLGDPDWGRIALTSPSSFTFLTTSTGAKLASFTLAGDTIKASALSSSHMFLLGDHGGVYIQELPTEPVGNTVVTQRLASPPSLPGCSLTYLPTPDLLVVTYTGGLVLVLGPGGGVLHSLQAPGTVTTLVAGPALVGRLEEGGYLLLTFTPSITSLPIEVDGVVVLDQDQEKITLLQLISSNKSMSQLCLAKIGPPNSRPRNVGVVCNYCDSILTNRRNFERHIEKLHVKNISTCTKCNLTFQDQHQLRTHSVKCRFACPFKDSSAKCGFVTSNKEDVIKHMKGKHNHNEQFACDVCDFKAGFQSLAAHKKLKHQENDSALSNSNERYIGTRDKHILSDPSYVINPKYRYDCTFKGSPQKCSFVSRKRYRMKLHIKRTHKQLLKFDSFDFKSRVKTLNVQLKLEQNEAKSPSLPKHKEMIDTENAAKNILSNSGMENTGECDYCGDEINTPSLMKEHIYAMHPAQIDLHQSLPLSHE